MRISIAASVAAIGLFAAGQTLFGQPAPQPPTVRVLSDRLFKEINEGLGCGINLTEARDRIAELEKQLQELKK